jgi:hypothetical protein
MQNRKEVESMDEMIELRIGANSPDSNIFAIMAKVIVILRETGRSNKVKEMEERVISSKSYEEALNSFEKYNIKVTLV